MTTETKLDCVFCKEVFEDKEALLVHFRKHGDPNFNTKNKSRQQNDMPKNEKSTEESEFVGCDVCEEVFPTISKAITHKHKAHPDHDAKYFCPLCGKLFTMKHLYKKHLKSNHNNFEGSDTNEFHCDYCDVSFYMPSAMLYHNKFFHRQDTEMPAFGQSKKVKTYNHVMIQIYYCAFCGEEYNNKVNLHKHMIDDHRDENQYPSEILRCPLCEAVFYHLDAYEFHLTFHSTEDLYSEQNEMKEKVTEFSLETVSPIIEKVEEEQEENDTNAEGIDSFLQLVMGESAANDASNKIKSKKHKKHKKSKKAAITLDEFLNMNKDVFGDGLDVQGIEEVPTQVVLKKVKGKKLPSKPETKMVNANLAKLKKHGIIVKTKSGNNPGLTNLKKEVNKSKIINTPTEILSKLMTQGNSQIKIVKKSVSQSAAIKEDTPISNMAKAVDKIAIASSNKDVTSDHEEKDEADNPTLDTPAVESDTNINTETLPEKEILTKSDANTLIKSDDNAGEDNEELYKNVKSTASECKTSYDTEGTKAHPIMMEEEHANISNIPSPKQHSKAINELKPSLTSESGIVKESLNSDNNDNDSKKQSETNITNNTLNALKHLSHLITVKPLNQSKTENVSCKTNEIPNTDNKTETNKDDREPDSTRQLTTEKKLPLNKPLGEHITIKPSKQSHSIINYTSDAESENGEHNDVCENELNTEKNNIDELETLNKSVVELKTLKVKNLPISKPISQDKVSIKNQIDKQTDPDVEAVKKENCPKKAHLDILKRLTNVTAKPITVTTNINQMSKIKQEKNVSQIKEVIPSKSKNCVDEEIEIFNIDDSDSEGNECDAVNNKIEEKPNVPLDALRNLGKNIVIKSNQQNVVTSESKEKKVNNKNTRSDIGGENVKLNKQSQDIQKCINLQNKLKNLGGNITIKSRNSSPNMYNTDLYKSFEDYDSLGEEDHSDSESIGKVKITELNENDVSDNECNENQTSAMVESPNASNSEHEDNVGMEDDVPDFENQIKTNTLKRENTVNSNKNSCLENFKNLNKHLTIKSLNTKRHDSEGDGLCQKEASDENLNKQVVTKSLKASVVKSEQPINKSSQQASGSTNQTSYNKKVSTSSNQVNTVKTVKRFQSQTVIEEITTTVTKTIRTVNQSTNEVMQNRCNIKPTIRPQKIVNKQPGRELQGTTVRHASPTIGTKIRNASPVVRNPNPSIVRPSNQLVPVRPALNQPRLTGPSPSAVRKVAPPKCSPQKPPIGKLKISPQALSQTAKRPSEESIGHFSCFKKPKESLVNCPDMADFEDDSAMQLSSSTQSRSDFSSVTKTVKGKGMVTATQTRSEVSMSSQQQLSRLSNVSGLKIMKTSSKQATQVEEKCEINTAKKNTLEALEKLQKQGLLIKKPRIDDYNEHPNSFSESDDEATDK